MRRELTPGELRVRKSSNPSEKADVKEAKRLCAELIDYTYDFVPAGFNKTQDEENRLLQNAMTCFEEGCMWLVKALTVPQD